MKKMKLNIGFIPLTDCATLVIAKEKGFFDKNNLDVQINGSKSIRGNYDCFNYISIVCTSHFFYTICYFTTYF